MGSKAYDRYLKRESEKYYAEQAEGDDFLSSETKETPSGSHIPEFKVFEKVKGREVETTLNQASKDGWVLVPDTFQWTMKPGTAAVFAHFVMIKDRYRR